MTIVENSWTHYWKGSIATMMLELADGRSQVCLLWVWTETHPLTYKER